ncbi:iron complex outermembrane receptor protein [Silvimonas terrae]|uniref:Iron complex outermembrane receptor protein n=1 Tax=Silvimonas terrae TaxID=300266 RepID=A0A840RJD5_9NEIS|nr:TonB-dependent copper receptor [Silvimonas terrae]MBB5193217.1 iron complex outermembrane receptor protein [Silvimonas terrae]
MTKQSPAALRLSVLTTALVTVFSASTRADDAVTAPPSQIIDLGSVVVTGVRDSSPLTIVTDPKAPRQPVPASDGADILKTIPGFSAVRNGGSNGDPVLRGMFGSRLNILTDGTTMLGACPARMDAPTSYISPSSFDTLTVIKGPESVIWGPGSSAGTVMFDRDTQRFDTAGVRLDGAVQGGSWGRNDINIDATTGTPDGYVRFTGNHGHEGDYEDGAGHDVPSAWNKWATDAALGWTPDDQTRLELNVGTGNGDARYAGRSMDGVQFKRESANLKFERTNISDVVSKVQAQVYYNYADHLMDNYSLRTPDPMSSMPMPMAAEVDRRTVGGRVAATLDIATDISVITGLDGSSNAHRSRSASGEGAYASMPWIKDADMSTLGGFAQLTWKPQSGSRVMTGLRLDHAIATDRRATTGMMSMANPTLNDTRAENLPSGFARYEHDLVDAPATVFIGLGHVERFPDYWELFSPDSGPASTTNAFTGVKPEKTTQLDLGAQYKDQNLKAWVSAYAGYVQDYILFLYSSGGMMGSTSQALNINARIAGGEAGVTWRFVQNWQLDVSTAYAWGQNQSMNQPLAQMPPLDTRLALAWEHDQWSAGALWRLVTAQNRVAENEGNVVGKDFGTTGGFGVLSLNGGYAVGKHVQLTAGVDNLLNKTYAEHLNLAGDAGFGYSGDSPVNEPGRTFWARLAFKY